jgi:hypothetical protein
VTATGFQAREGRHEKMPDHDRRVAIALLTRWFEHVQVGGAFNDTIFAIFSEDSPLGRFADGEMISFDEETLYELANRDYGLDVWALGPSHAAHEMKENAVDGNSPMQAGTAAIAAIKGYMRGRLSMPRTLTITSLPSAGSYVLRMRACAQDASGNRPLCYYTCKSVSLGRS